MFCKNDSLLILLQFQALLWNNNNVFIADLQEWRDSSTDHDQHHTFPFQLGVAFNGQEPGPLLHHQHHPNGVPFWKALAYIADCIGSRHLFQFPLTTFCPKFYGKVKLWNFFSCFNQEKTPLPNKHDFEIPQDCVHRSKIKSWKA